MHTEGTVRHKLVWARAGGVAILVLSLAAGAGCGNTESNSPAYIMVDSLTTSLQSDVFDSLKSAFFEDQGSVTFRLGLRDPGAIGGALLPGPSNYITVTHYRVVYTRTDGRNTPGVDVPYSFEGGMTVTAIPGTVTSTFILVRAQAKLEAPLRALVGLGGQVVISTTAEVTFYGHDQAGNAVSTTGYVSVTFADWADS